MKIEDLLEQWKFPPQHHKEGIHDYINIIEKEIKMFNIYNLTLYQLLV